MNLSAAELVLGNIFTGNGFHNFRTGKEHIRYAFGHNGEVCESRGVNRTACARTENAGNLGNNARCEDIALENL